MRKTKGKNGITLVALVITIVILLILAGISISALTNTGIFQKAKDAQRTSENAEKEQSQTLGEYEKVLNEYTAQELTDDKINKVLSYTDNTILKDAKGNIFTLPAGFKVVVNEDTNNAKTVDKGIVIEDATVDNNGNTTPTNGSQFVWVPVGDITKEDGTIATIILGRYDFNRENGKESKYSGNYVEEDSSDSSTLKKLGNTIAKNITEFKNSVAINNGYYIGRYEARTITTRIAKEDKLEQITENVINNIYNYVTQPQAAQLSQNMYDSQKFTSDLMNSYAWETTIVFIQKCTNKTKYAYQTSLDEENKISQYGTQVDKQNNIFDMASNIREWTTETSSNSKLPCVNRGGIFGNNNDYTIFRGSLHFSTSYDGVGFRPILYINN